MARRVKCRTKRRYALRTKPRCIRCDCYVTTGMRWCQNCRYKRRMEYAREKHGQCECGNPKPPKPGPCAACRAVDGHHKWEQRIVSDIRELGGSAFASELYTTASEQRAVFRTLPRMVASGRLRRTMALRTFEHVRTRSFGCTHAPLRVTTTQTFPRYELIDVMPSLETPMHDKQPPPLVHQDSPPQRR